MSDWVKIVLSITPVGIGLDRRARGERETPGRVKRTQFNSLAHSDEEKFCDAVPSPQGGGVLTKVASIATRQSRRFSFYFDTFKADEKKRAVASPQQLLFFSFLAGERHQGRKRHSFFGPLFSLLYFFFLPPSLVSLKRNSRFSPLSVARKKKLQKKFLSLKKFFISSSKRNIIPPRSSLPCPSVFKYDRDEE